MLHRALLNVGFVYRFKRGRKHIRVLSRGNMACIDEPSSWYYTVKVLETGKSYDQFEHALAPQLVLWKRE